MASIDSIDTVYRNDSKDIVVFNPRSSETLNPILNRDSSSDIENNQNEIQNQIRSILLSERERRRQLPTYFVFFLMLAGSIFVSVIIVVVLDNLGLIN
jgi:hypothetical protein